MDSPKTKAQLAAENQALRDLLDMLPVSVIVYEEDGSSSFANKLSISEVGIGADKFGSQKYYVAGTDKLYPLWKSPRDLALAGLSQYVDDLEIELVNGDRLPLEAWSAPLQTDGNGKVMQAVVVASSIAEKKAAETALRESNLRLSEIIDIAQDAIVSVDENHIVTLFNNGAERVFGYKEDEVVGQPLEILLPEFLHSDHHRLVKEFGDSEINSRVMSTRGELSGIRKNGEQFPAEVSISKVTVGGKAIFTAFLQDISTRKRAEARQTALEQKLYQTQKMETVGRLAGGIAHELNNMLSPILGYAEILMLQLKKRGEDPAHANAIYRSAQRAKSLVSKILLFSRRGPSEHMSVDLVQLLQELVEFTRLTQPKNITLNLTCASETAPILGSSIQIYQVMSDLCINAQQAILDSGNIEIAIDILELENHKCGVGERLSGKFVRVTVSDDGCGMDKRTAERIFEPFYTTREVGEGSGLGLSAVFGIVENHKGGINVSTVLGKGSSFEIYLPFFEGESKGRL